MPGEAATLALSGGLGEISGDRRARMGHTYPLPGSFTPQAALLPQYARLPRRVPMHTARAFARVTGVIGGGEHPWAPVSRLRV